MAYWNALRTAEKIRFARLLYWVVAGWRALSKQSKLVLTERRGVMFELDPAEGIEFAMYLFAAFEPETYGALRRLVRPGHTVLDIGANSGIHTLPTALLAGENGRVIAFEPTAGAFRRLQRNLALNPLLAGRVTAVQAYLVDVEGSEGAGVAAFYSSWRLDGADAQHPKHFGTLVDATGAVATTLDTYLERADVRSVDVIKIDVDGYECKVLRGAERMLKRDRPALVVELCPYALEEQGDSADVLLQLLISHGYAFFDEGTGKPLPHDPDRIKALVKPDSSINLVALA